MRLATRIVLPAPPDTVWAVLSDWRRYAGWMVDVAWVRPLTAPHEGVGMRLAIRTKVLGLPLVTDRLEVTAWEPPHRLAIRHLGGIRGWGEWRLRPRAGGTAFTWVEQLRMPPPALGEIALQGYRPFLRRAFLGSMRNLERLLSSR